MDQAQNVMGERMQATKMKQMQGRLWIYVRDREEKIKKFHSPAESPICCRK